MLIATSEPRGGAAVAWPGVGRGSALADLLEVRATTERLCRPLSAEDAAAQSMPEASPVKWHLAHTTWFFEAFLLARRPGYRAFDSRFGFLFGSGYEALGDGQARQPRSARSVLTRPPLERVIDYRREIDDRLVDFLTGLEEAEWLRLQPIVALGVAHEQQHQERILADVKHLFASNPLRPGYRELRTVGESPEVSTPPSEFVWFDGGERQIGYRGGGFAFDNERPVHTVYLDPFGLADRLATSGEYLAFVADGGYRRPELWLADGWAAVRAQDWRAPLYWERVDPNPSAAEPADPSRWCVQTLDGPRALDPAEPACHLSWFEADAFARWSGARLPREEEWEVAAADQPVEGNFQESARLHPRPLRAPRPGVPSQLFGDVWEWTSSPYVGYPGYRPAEGALGESNGKFMCNQFVLRGGSCASPSTHLRASYRGFLPPATRWHFAGVRLAEDP